MQLTASLLHARFDRCDLDHGASAYLLGRTYYESPLVLPVCMIKGPASGRFFQPQGTTRFSGSRDHLGGLGVRFSGSRDHRIFRLKGPPGG